MLALKPFAETHGRSMVQAQAIPPVRLLALHGFSTHQLAYMLDSLVRVSRRVDKRHFVRVPQTHDSTPGHTDQEAFPAHSRKPDLPAPRGAPANTTSHRFHFSNFRYSLTLFSKFFASFPHGTCSLSVYHQYLALDGIYHPIRAAIPNNSTRRRHVQ